MMMVEESSRQARLEAKLRQGEVVWLRVRSGGCGSRLGLE